jgi:pyruvate kinase
MTTHKEFKKTKIIATIGPASNNKQIIKEMIGLGVNCARINTAHGDFDQYTELIKLVRSVSDIPIMIDIKGPEIRIKTNEEIEVTSKNPVVFGFNEKSDAYFNYNFYDEVFVGDTIFFDNGLITSKILKKYKDKQGNKLVLLKFENNVLIKPNKGVNIPNRKLKIPSLSKKDIEAVKFSIKHNISYIALSFARNKEDVLNLRKLLGKNPINIIAKIENIEGVELIDEIIKYSDGVMIARGDLGIEIPAEKIPSIQKEIISKCNREGKIAIVATQMLESMINSPVPTRAEVSDVANAVLDGADAIMLSGETATGKYPVRAVEVMKRVAIESEKNVTRSIDNNNEGNISYEMSEVAYHLSGHANATAIVCITRSGFTARLIARFKPKVPILAIATDNNVRRHLELVWGVQTIILENIPTRAIMPTVAKHLADSNILTQKDVVVFMGGIRTLKDHVSNVIEVHNIGDILEFHKRFGNNPK